MSGFTSLEQYLEFKENISKNYIKNIYCKINNNNNITYGDNNFYSSSSSYDRSTDNTVINSIISNATSSVCSTSNAKIGSMIG